MKISIQMVTKRLLFLSVLFFVAVQFSAANLEDDTNPFLPKDYGKSPVDAEKPTPLTQRGPLSQKLDFRGVFKFRDEYQFSIFNKQKNEASWVGEDKVVDGLGVRGFDPDALTIVVTMEGQSERLTLMSASDKALPVNTSVATTDQETPDQVTDDEANRPIAPRRQVIPRRRVVLPSSK